jgi:hypothetical protein
MATSIQSSEILSDRPQADGRRYVRVKFICEAHDSSTEDVFVGPRLVASDFDVNAWIASHGDNILEQLAKREEEEAKNLNAVEDPLFYTLNPKWSTTKRIAITLLSWMMQEKDVRIVLYLETLIAYIQANYNGSQIASLLDTNIATVQRLNRRVNAVLTDTGTVKDLLSTYDIEEGHL